MIRRRLRQNRVLAPRAAVEDLEFIPNNKTCYIGRLNLRIPKEDERYTLLWRISACTAREGQRHAGLCNGADARIACLLSEP